MDKEVLYQYIDACELVRETEQEIRQLRQRRVGGGIVTDKVKGSSYDFPFREISYVICGIPYDVQESGLLETKEQLLEERKAAAEAIMERSGKVRYRYLDG